jgi:hypothetical protein
MTIWAWICRIAGRLRARWKRRARREDEIVDGTAAWHLGWSITSGEPPECDGGADSAGTDVADAP